MTKHSPGPWKWTTVSHIYGGDPGEPGNRSVLIDGNESFVLATHPDDDKIVVLPEDAALIAAAPEMLDLLRIIRDEAIRDDVSDRVFIHERHRRAINAILARFPR